MKKILTFVFLFISFSLYAQQTHTVKAKETVYGISKKYNISQEALLKANPKIESRGLHPGDVLTIPSKDGKIFKVEEEPKLPKNNQTLTPPSLPKDDNNYTYLLIEPKETIYSLTKKYDISEATLVSLNPQLKHGLKAGDIIRLPKTSNKNSTTTEKEIVPDGMHLVRKGETLYSIAKKYNFKVEDFYATNPDLQTKGTQEGMYLIIPRKGSNAIIRDNFIEHKVKAGETIYGLTTEYQVSMDQLLKANANLATKGLLEGSVLRIPLQEGAKITTTASVSELKRISDNEINVVMFFPFDLGKGNLSKNLAMNFFSGSKVALEKLAKEGKNVNVKVIDSERDVNKLFQINDEYDLNKADVIIGPFYASSVEQAAQMLSNANIPIVSPFANANNLDNYGNVIMATPRDEVLADQIINEIAKDYAKEQIYLLTEDKYKDLAEYTRKELTKKLKANVVIVTDVNKVVQPTEVIGADKYVKPIVTVLISDNDQLGISYLNKLKTFDVSNLKAFGIKSVSVYDIFSKNNQANIEALKAIGFVYSTSRLMNIYGTKEQEILKLFNDNYCSAPSDYEQFGYDVTYDIISRMNFKGDFTGNLSAENTQLSSKFSYKRLGNNKAYVNDAVRVVRLSN
ncbi:LysM peptidoglycan-binding domain-containing protein [Weeksella sp. HMSC059D05]|uniref:LysM peptidoglycan-binding domain-containing protein n=1 Tax=Weeksella sp. HMSC059D05 TaxID=1715139 RepID=UPI0008A3E392|nr:LysM peptidoglycan-binding domain-containing protein [Weeksella sp. HMSC059D05]OFM81787.1 peptidoglycan-binding protein [Weeksella sp. HMSC059D05]